MRETNFTPSRDLLIETVSLLQSRGLYAATMPSHLRAARYFHRPSGVPAYGQARWKHGEFRQPRWSVDHNDRTVRVEGLPVELVLDDWAGEIALAVDNKDAVLTWCDEEWIYHGDASQIIFHDHQWLFHNEVEPHFGGRNPDHVSYACSDLRRVCDALVAYYFQDNCG